MDQSPSWEANRFSASQEIPRLFMEPESSLPHSQVPTTCPYPKPARSSHYVPVKKCCTATHPTEKKKMWHCKADRFVACRFLWLGPVLRTMGRQKMTHFFPLITHCASSFQLFWQQGMRRFDITKPQRPESSFYYEANQAARFLWHSPPLSLFCVLFSGT